VGGVASAADNWDVVTPSNATPKREMEVVEKSEFLESEFLVSFLVFANRF